jgi:hypothetical protein
MKRISETGSTSTNAVHCYVAPGPPKNGRCS